MFCSSTEFLPNLPLLSCGRRGKAESSLFTVRIPHSESHCFGVIVVADEWVSGPLPLNSTASIDTESRPHPLLPVIPFSVDSGYHTNPRRCGFPHPSHAKEITCLRRPPHIGVVAWSLVLLVFVSVVFDPYIYTPYIFSGCLKEFPFHFYRTRQVDAPRVHGGNLAAVLLFLVDLRQYLVGFRVVIYAVKYCSCLGQYQSSQSLLL